MAYESSRLWPDSRSRTRIAVAPADEITPEPLDRFLTARFRLYSFVLGKLVRARVEHRPWRLRSARLLEADQTLTAAAGLSQPPQPDSALYSPGVDVRIGPLERV